MYQSVDADLCMHAEAACSALPACLPAYTQLYQLLSDRFPFWDVELHQLPSLGGSAIRQGILHGLCVPICYTMEP